MARHDYPSIAQLAKQLHSIKPRKGDYPDIDDCMDVRLQVLPGSGWSLHTGDAQYDQDHRGFWGCGTLSPTTNCRDLARDLIAVARSEAQWHAVCTERQAAIIRDA